MRIVLLPWQHFIITHEYNYNKHMRHEYDYNKHLHNEYHHELNVRSALLISGHVFPVFPITLFFPYPAIR